MDSEIMMNSTPVTNAKKDYSRMGFAVAAFVFLFNVLVLGGQVLMILIQGKDSVSINMVIILNIIVELLIAFPVYRMIADKTRTKLPEKKTMKFGSFLSVVCMMYTVSIIGSLIGQFINGILSDTTGKASNANLDVLFVNSFALTAIFSVIIAPIIEEVVFRKILIDKLHTHSQKYAMIISGLSFGLMHGNLEQFFYTFFLGLLFAFVYIKTGKIKYTIILHFILNGASVLIQFAMSKLTIMNDMEAFENMSDAQIVEALMGDETQLIAFLVMGLVALMEYAFAFIGAILLIKNRKKFTLEKNENDADFKTAFINKGMITSIVVMLAVMLLGFVIG